MIEIPCMILQVQDRCVPVLRSITRPMCRVTSLTLTAVFNRSMRLLRGNWTEFSSHRPHFLELGLLVMCSIHNQPLPTMVVILETTHVNWLSLHQLTSSSHSLLQMRQTSTHPVRYKVCLYNLTKNEWYWNKPKFERFLFLAADNVDRWWNAMLETMVIFKWFLINIYTEICHTKDLLGLVSHIVNLLSALPLTLAGQRPFHNIINIYTHLCHNL